MTVDNEDVLSTAVIGIWEGVVTGKFYFSDETYDLNGPYNTIPEAEVRLWVHRTNNPPQCNVKYYGA